MTKFDVFIAKNYPGLNFLSISMGNYMPGVVINNDDRVIDALPRVFSNQDPKFWKTKIEKANLAGETIQGSKDLKIGASVLGIFTLKGGITSAYTVTFQFGEAFAVIFDTANGGLYENEVRNLIMELKQKDRGRWKDILHNNVIMESIFVKSVTVEFKRNGQVLTDVDLPIVKNEVSINGEYSWAAGGKMEIKNNDTPFGVRGFIVKRYM